MCKHFTAYRSQDWHQFHKSAKAENNSPLLQKCYPAEAYLSEGLWFIWVLRYGDITNLKVSPKEAVDLLVLFYMSLFKNLSDYMSKIRTRFLMTLWLEGWSRSVLSNSLYVLFQVTDAILSSTFFRMECHFTICLKYCKFVQHHLLIYPVKYQLASSAKNCMVEFSLTGIWFIIQKYTRT